ncbi:50S ribosomal protein L14 [Candidatus Woesearchaeota archaeon]|nr:50S ribosomal protein L14 [Candidatus Woesearchaeota archaeon]
MKPIKARMTRGLQHVSNVPTCDNSGAKIVRIISVKHSKTVKGRTQQAGIGDMVMVSVVSGNPEVRKKVFPAIVVRQRKEFRRLDGTRVKFEDNAVVVLKDEDGNPKGTMLKGAIPKEVVDRWPAVGKIGGVVV